MKVITEAVLAAEFRENRRRKYSLSDLIEICSGIPGPDLDAIPEHPTPSQLRAAGVAEDWLAVPLCTECGQHSTVVVELAPPATLNPLTRVPPPTYCPNCLKKALDGCQSSLFACQG